MQTLKFEFDPKGEVYDFTPTLVSYSIPERGFYYCIHDATKRPRDGRRAYIVSIFPENDDDSIDLIAPLYFREFPEVVRAFEAFGLKIDTESVAVKLFLGEIKRKANRDDYR
jgi:hypothetical protein